MVYQPKTHQSFPVTEFDRIEHQLHRSGKLAEYRRQNGFSMSVLEREAILEARKNAQLYGLSYGMIAAIEEEGAKGVRS